MPTHKEVLLDATNAAGKIIQEYFQGSFSVTNKEGINNLVTEVDTKSETAILDIIKKEFPEHYIVSEEVGELSSGSDYKWVIDPIDGTVNFAHGIPICCVSIALLHHNQPILGAVYNPMMNEFFFAEKGEGAALFLLRSVKNTYVRHQLLCSNGAATKRTFCAVLVNPINFVGPQWPTTGRAIGGQHAPGWSEGWFDVSR